MYKAKIDIGEFKKGDKVPDEKALIWKDMYLESPVEEIIMTEAQLKAQEKKEVAEAKKAEEAKSKEDAKAAKEAEKAEAEETEEEKSSDDSSDPLLDDYLNRNQNVVLKNLNMVDSNEIYIILNR